MKRKTIGHITVITPIQLQWLLSLRQLCIEKLVVYSQIEDTIKYKEWNDRYDWLSNIHSSGKIKKEDRTKLNDLVKLYRSEH